MGKAQRERRRGREIWGQGRGDMRDGFGQGLQRRQE